MSYSVLSKSSNVNLSSIARKGWKPFLLRKVRTHGPKWSNTCRSCRSCRSCRMLNRSESYRINKAVESVDFAILTGPRSSQVLTGPHTSWSWSSSHELMKSLGATPVAFLPSTTLERDSTYEQQLLKSDVDSVTKKRLSVTIDSNRPSLLQPSTRSTIHYHYYRLPKSPQSLSPIKKMQRAKKVWKQQPNYVIFQSELIGVETKHV